jgi:transcriptional regulatory protein LevR
MQSNAVTEVKIGEETMTVAEAIERKSSIEYHKALLQTMRHQLHYVQTRVQELEEETRDRLDRLLESKLGKEGKTREEDLKAITKNFEEKNMPKIIDPLNLQKQIEDLDEYIDNFENEVDLVLSESNAQTEIEVAD